MAEDSLETQEPRWEVINELYDSIDGTISNMFKDKHLSFGEIEIGMKLMEDKILQQKMELMFQFIKEKDEQDSEEKKAPDHLYK
jgi:hypothetical protein|tara:strand:- start:1373 stop:1624 length:252 start_codon:yes stop_codon:yes gene_type:complete